MKLFLFIILFSSSSFAQQGILGNYLKLNPTTLPAVCSAGTTRFDSSGHTLSLCYPANTWTAVGSGGGGGGTSNPVTLAQIPTPTAAPSPSVSELYFKSDGNLYSLNHANQEVQVGPGTQATNWVAYTPTFTGFGTVTANSFFSRRVGDTLEIQGTLSPGNGTHTLAEVSIGYGGVNGNVTIDSTKIASNTQVGTFSTSNFASTFFGISVLATGGNTFLNFGFQSASAGAATSANGDALVASGDSTTFFAKVPIAGWTTQSPAAPGQSGANFFASSQITTGSSQITSTSFTTFDVSPAFTFTPTVTGTYKVYSSPPWYQVTSGRIGIGRIFNTSGGATLLYESQVAVYNNAGQNISSGLAQSVYTLNAGTTYVFDLQGKNDTGAGHFALDGSDAFSYMFAELYAGTIGNGVTQIGNLDAAATPGPQGSVLSNNVLYEQSASSSVPGLVNNTTQTFSGVKTFSSAPSMSGASITSSTVPLLSLSSSAYNTAPTASTLVEWDANKNLSDNAIIPGFTTTATAAGTTTMTIASTETQVWTGSSAQTIKLPTTSIAQGAIYRFINLSTASLTIQSSGANTINTALTNTEDLCTAVVATPTTAANWSCRLVALGTIPVGLGGTGATSLVSGAVSSNGTVLSSGVLSVANGGTASGAVTIAPTATHWAGWDANSNLVANNHIQKFTTTATAAGTTTLVVGSTYIQAFTGATTQTVTLPVATGLANGQGFLITNASSGIVTVQTSGAVTVKAMAGSSQLLVWVINTAGGTGTASWNWQYTATLNN